MWLDYSKAVVARRLVGRVFRQLLLRHERHGRKTTVRSALERELPFVTKTLRSCRRRRAHGTGLAAKATFVEVRVARVPSPTSAGRLLQQLAEGRSGA